MSRLDELIRELCPDGVEYKPFNLVAQYVRGVTYGKAHEVNDGRDGYNLLRANNITLSSNTLNFDEVKIVDFAVKVKESKKLKKGDILICAGSGSKEHIGKVAYIFEDIDYTFGGFMGVVRANTGAMLSRFMFHILTGSHFKEHLSRASGASSSTINNINNDTWKDFILPVPPIEVQREIVRILDKFTELSAELSARQRQYEYYRDSLFAFDNNVALKPMSELFPLIRNGFVGTVTNDFTDAAHGVRYLRGTNIHDGMIGGDDFVYVTHEFHKKHIKTELKADDIIMVQSGHVGECAVVGEKFAGSNCHALIVMSNGGQCDSRYITYYLHSSEGKKKLAAISTGGTVKHILASAMKKFVVPVPSLVEQQRIVSNLDRFDALCNDLSSGLPAEIEARQKQYEYYRDKLLTFKPLA